MDLEERLRMLESATIDQLRDMRDGLKFSIEQQEDDIARLTRALRLDRSLFVIVLEFYMRRFLALNVKEREV